MWSLSDLFNQVKEAPTPCQLRVPPVFNKTLGNMKFNSIFYFDSSACQVSEHHRPLQREGHSPSDTGRCQQWLRLHGKGVAALGQAGQQDDLELSAARVLVLAGGAAGSRERGGLTTGASGRRPPASSPRPWVELVVR